MARRGICSSPPNVRGVLLEGSGGERFDAGAGAERGERLVEADVPGLADAQELQVNAAEALDGGLVAAAFLVQVAREAIGQVGVPRINVHVAEQVVIHVVAVGVRVGGKQADILVEVERAAEREIKLLSLVHADEVAIDAFHRLAGRQPQNEMRVGAQLAGHNPAHQGRGRFLIRLYDDFHRGGIVARTDAKGHPEMEGPHSK